MSQLLRGEKLREGKIYKFNYFIRLNMVGEFNQHKERFLQRHQDLFTHSELIAFEVLSQYSVVVPKVANAKIATPVPAVIIKETLFYYDYIEDTGNVYVKTYKAFHYRNFIIITSEQYVQRVDLSVRNRSKIQNYRIK
jgi:hypothetical protein